MSGHRAFIGVAMFAVMMLLLSVDGAYAQTSSQEDEDRAAAVDEVEGEEREVTLTEAITAEPARPLIQFTHNRPGVSFKEVRVGPSSRTFYPELRRGNEMEVGSPVIDILVLFPGILP